MGPFGAGDHQYSLGEAQIVSNLMLFPVRATLPDPNPHFRTLEEGLTDGTVKISEPGKGHTRVGIKNDSEDDVFIIDGEGITGGMQNRIAAASMVIGSRKSQQVPVYCSEHGRWSGSQAFAAANEIAYPSIRRLSTVSRSSRHTEAYIQSSVWSEISRKQKSLKVNSPTQSMQDIYAKKEPELRRFQEYEPAEDQVGLLAATQKRILCIDIFYNHPLYGRFSKKLLISCALESIEDEDHGSGVFDYGKCEEFFQGVMTAQPVRKGNPGSESYYQVQTPGSLGVGKVLYYKKEAVHASFFPVSKF